MVTAERTDAWVLEEGAGDDEVGVLRREEILLPPIDGHEVLVEPLYGSWEGNMAHAVRRKPIDICRARNEPKVVIGNAGVVRVLAVGREVEGIAAEDCCMFFSAGVTDEHGYMVLAHAYDAPGTIGLLAKRTKVHARNLVPIPAGSRFSLEQWAAFSLRYMTAWSNWRVAYTCFRSQLNEDDVPIPHVWGWGGGCTLAELELARINGCEVAMLSGSAHHLDTIEGRGVTAIDRRDFPNLDFDERRYHADESYRTAYLESESRFLATVGEHTDDKGVSIFIDYIGGPVVRATQKALGRLGVVSTAGWKHGMVTPMNRAMECIARHIHVHTHYARISEAAPAMAFAEATGWMPDVAASKVYSFDEIPQLVADYDAGRTDYFPVYAVNGAASSRAATGSTSTLGNA
jgi:NADPH:quinone reductase-like Zn-dependent oxidoreductase